MLINSLIGMEMLSTAPLGKGCPTMELNHFAGRIVKNDIRERYNGQAKPIAEELGLQLGHRTLPEGDGWAIGRNNQEIICFWHLAGVKDFVFYVGQQVLLGSN